MRKQTEPIFKEYDNAQINASAFWDITPVQDNTRPICSFAPFNSYQVQNDSDYNISVKLNGSNNKGVVVFAGCGVIMYGHKYTWLRITNKNASNAIAINLINVLVGKDIETLISG